MNKNKYNYILLGILLLSDFFSGALSFWLTLFNQNTFTFELILSVLFLHCCWSIVFFFANLYNTRATLSRFDEIIRLVPIIYSVLFIYIAFNVFGVINFNSEYKSILTYGIVFSTLLIVNRFIIHSVQ